MADLAQIEQALRAADAAGNVEDAKLLAQAYADAKASASPAPAAQPQPELQRQSVSPVADAIRSIPGGVAQGVSGVLGLPRDLNDLANEGVRWVGNKLSPGAGDRAIEWGNAHPGIGTQLTGLMLPGSAKINKAISEPFGGYYKPQTTAGEYAQTISSFAPNALLPGSLPARAARVVAPGTLSETAGQLTKGTKYELPARAAGALAGGLGVGAAEAALSKPKVPTLVELDQMKDAAYKAADQAGVVISPQSFQKFATDIGDDLTRNNVVQADIHPHTLAALKVLQEEAASGVPVSLARADAVRQAVKGAIEKASGATGSNTDLRLAMKVKQGLDDYLDALTPADTLAGNSSVAVPILKEARSLNQRKMKGEEIQKLIDLAENQASTNYSASGMEQALRVQFKNLNAELIKNPSLAKTFTDAEREAIKTVAKGGPVGNALRLVGKLAPTNVISGGMGAGAGAYVGGAMGGPVGAGIGAVAVPTVGALARQGASALTMKNAENAATLMRAGPLMAAPPVANDLSRGLFFNALLSQQTPR